MLAINGGKKVLDMDGPHFSWPLITDEVERVVIEQLRKTISIYDKSGVIDEFETIFSKYHGRKYALLSNSGTSAIFSMFEGINVTQGDEILCPTYTFHATITPLLYTGGVPVFCEIKEDGNIDPEDIVSRISDKTKAIIVTHMWGIPCDMERIVEICNDYNLILLEDCSHAHGAKIKNKPVGSFGIAAAWSLQGQKIISGGEGGVLLTDDCDLYERALLQGHYNKRCKQEIRKSSYLYDYYLTGLGLKLRSHPLAVAIAKEQFSHLDDWVRQKNIFAERVLVELKQFSFLRMPSVGEDILPSWYAFVMNFKEENANGVGLQEFCDALHAEGLLEVDLPRSTGLLHCLPIFKDLSIVFPNSYRDTDFASNQSFPMAEKFYHSAIKIPIWAQSSDVDIVDKYIEGFQKVCTVVRDSPELLLKR